LARGNTPRNLKVNMLSTGADVSSDKINSNDDSCYLSCLSLNPHEYLLPLLNEKVCQEVTNVKALLDNGSSYNLINRTTFKKLNLSQEELCDKG
jgi:hypothetical protein